MTIVFKYTEPLNHWRVLFVSDKNNWQLVENTFLSIVGLSLHMDSQTVIFWNGPGSVT